LVTESKLNKLGNFVKMKIYVITQGLLEEDFNETLTSVPDLPYYVLFLLLQSFMTSSYTR